MKSSKILVVGSINVDYFISTDVFPKAGETVAGNGFRKAAGGKGANQAVQMARLGNAVTMVGAVGGDADGREMRDLLAFEGLDTRYLAEKRDLPTGCAVIVLHGSQNRIIVYSGANGGLEKSDIEFLKEGISEYDMVVLQLEVPMEINETVAKYANIKGVPVFLNTAPYAPLSSELLSCVTYICPNETETQSLTGIEIPTDGGNADIAIAKKAAEKIVSLGAKNVIITLGGAGAYFYGECGEYYSPAAKGVNVVDTTAAGDSFIGGFVHAIASGMDTESALSFANSVASITVSRKGAIPSLPKTDEIEKH